MNDRQCKYGSFDLSRGATYTITDTKLKTEWEYIYQNRDVLLRLDQCGIVNAQATPPMGIMLLRRCASDRFSQWQVWVHCQQSGECVSNFAFPRLVSPKTESITFAPESAIYRYEYADFEVITRIAIPNSGTAIVMEVQVKNTTNKALDFTITTAANPYVSNAIMAPWDKSEWYLATGVGKTNEGAEFFTRQNSPSGEKSQRRMVTLRCSGGTNQSAEIDMREYIGCGSFDLPDFVTCQKQKNISLPNLAYSVKKLDPPAKEGEQTMYGYAPVYAQRSQANIVANGQCRFSQVLSMQDAEKCGVYDSAQSDFFAQLLNEKALDFEILQVSEFYKNLFSFRTVKTDDEIFDHYVNTFLPLQMYWVASLDRGWPTGMRGVRDASNDFMGMMMFDTDWTKKVIKEIFSCQRRDGWLPRQISAEGATGKHDLRPYCDGAAFAMELVYEYINETADSALLNERVGWLDERSDSQEDNTSTIWQHYLRALEWYLAPENIGQHGLCKIYGGDWLDAVNRAGLEGRGESVTVTGQTIINLLYAAELIQFKSGANISHQDKELVKRFNFKAQQFRVAMQTAYNKAGFFNSVFTDNASWLFSDKDEDGAKRLYGPANYYAILSGSASLKQCDSIWENVKQLKCESGYRLFAPALGNPPIAGVGRIASGDMPDGLWENGNVYNHGSHGFMARALAFCNNGEMLRQVINYMLPYSQKTHPVSATLSAPYAMVNCYQRLPLRRHFAGSPFLTGTIAIALRTVYRWAFGILPVYDGLCLAPCLEKGFKNASVKLILRKKKIEIAYEGIEEGCEPTILVANKCVQVQNRAIGAQLAAFLPEDLLYDGVKITVKF